VARLSVAIAHELRHFRLELTLETESVIALVGPSGAGKSTVLGAIAGLVRPARGRVALDDEVWFDAERRIWLAPDRRRVGLVFQEYALFPHMNVRQNVAYGGSARADELMERLRIAHLAGARPDQLSGGERQRVALARALAREPAVLLLDEPLSALDPHTKTAVRAELAALLADLRLPTLIVTHDYADAVAVAGTVGVLVTGSLRQLGSPAELLSHPADAYVAAFTGANLLHGRATARPGALTAVVLETGGVIYSTDVLDGAVDVVVQPWDVALVPDDASNGAAAPNGVAPNEIRAAIESLTPAGGSVRARVGPLEAEIANETAVALALAPAMIVRASFGPAVTRLIARVGEIDHRL
jgi:ABC-type sulfate/molybdate transport systems ATPase subunit